MWPGDWNAAVVPKRRLVFRRAISADILEFRARVLVSQAAGPRATDNGADFRHGSGPSLRASARCACLGQSPRDARVRGFRFRLSVIMQPRRWMDTSRRPPIGWPERGPGGQWPHVPSGLLELRPLCRSTSRPASVRETPNGEAPGCVLRRRIRLIAGPSWRCPMSGGRSH